MPRPSNIGTFVTISVGSEDKVKVDDEYHLSRGPHYVSKIDIIRVSEDSAVGRFDEKFNGPVVPRVGDKAWVD